MQPTEPKLKRIFDKKMAETLVNRGCQIDCLERHKTNPNWIIFRFINDDKFQQELSKLLSELKQIKLQK